jgi:protein-tyrosine-phosphatase
VGLFDFLRGKDEKAIPDPGTPEFEAMVQGSAIPDEQSVEMGKDGWTSTEAGGQTEGKDQIPEEARQALEKLGIDPSKADVEVEQTSQTIDLRGTGAREEIAEVLRKHGIDPDQEGQTIDATDVPGLKEAILGALFKNKVQIPEAGGFGGGISPPPQDPLAMIEHLDKKRDAGEITDAEFEAQKQKLLGDSA